MNRQTVKLRIAKMFKKATKWYLELDFERIIQVALSSASMLPGVYLEPFMSKTFGYKQTDFANPSVAAQGLRDSTVEMMSKPGTSNYNHALLAKSRELTMKQLGLKESSLSMCDQFDAVEAIPTETSAGPWRFTRPKSQDSKLILYEMNQIIMNGAFDVLTQTCFSYIAWRTQERESGTKFRQIFVMPHIFIAFEYMFAKPIFDMFYSYDAQGIFTSYSFNATWQDNSKLWEYLQTKNKVVGLDYSDFDRRVSNELLYVALLIIKSLFRLDQKWQSDLFDAIIHVHLNCPILSNYKGSPIIFVKQSGLLSGSVFTNLLGTIINALIINYCLLELGEDPTQLILKFKGDDTLVGCNTLFDYKLLSKLAEVRFGAKLNPDRTEVFSKGERIYYLGYYFDNRSKLPTSIGVLFRKIAISGRFISDEIMNEPTRVISKIISVLSNVSTGKQIFLESFQRSYLEYYGLSEVPKYFFDLAETETHNYSLSDQKSVWAELESGWMYK